MITAKTIKILSNLTSQGLDQALSNAGYTMFERVMNPEFVGITNAGEFCYTFSYRNSTEGIFETGKLFVKFDENGLIVADY